MLGCLNRIHRACLNQSYSFPGYGETELPFSGKDFMDQAAETLVMAIFDLKL